VPALKGYRAPGDPWSAEILISGRGRILAKAAASPFKIDYFRDLANWRNLVSRFNGTLILEEEME